MRFGIIYIKVSTQSNPGQISAIWAEKTNLPLIFLFDFVMAQNTFISGVTVRDYCFFKNMSPEILYLVFSFNRSFTF